MSEKTTPAELWAKVEEIAAVVESRLRVDDGRWSDPSYVIERRIEHRQQLTKLHTAFWKLFRGWSR